MIKLTETELNQACHLAHTAGKLLDAAENATCTAGIRLAELLMSHATAILNPAITVDVNALTPEAIDKLRASAGLGPITPVREARTRERGEHYQKDDGPLSAEMVAAIRATSMVGDLADDRFTKSIAGLEDITPETDHRVMLKAGTLVKINGIPVQIMHGVTIQTHSANVPLLGLE